MRRAQLVEALPPPGSQPTPTWEDRASDWLAWCSGEIMTLTQTGNEVTGTSGDMPVLFFPFSGRCCQHRSGDQEGPADVRNHDLTP